MQFTTVFDSETLAMVSPSAAAFTVSSHEVFDQKEPAVKRDVSVCDTPGCVLAGEGLN